MRIRRTRLLALILLLLVLLLGGWLLFRRLNSVAYVQEQNWGISIPGRWTQRFHTESEPDSWFGDGVRYTVYETEDVSGFSLPLTEPVQDETRHTVTELLTELDIPTAYQPDWSASCTYGRLEHLAGDTADDIAYILWFPSCSRILFVESFT